MFGVAAFWMFSASVLQPRTVSEDLRQWCVGAASSRFGVESVDNAALLFGRGSRTAWRRGDRRMGGGSAAAASGHGGGRVGRRAPAYTARVCVDINIYA